MHMEPFSIISSSISFDVSTVTHTAFSSLAYFEIVPVPSICPDTIWPPNLPSAAIALSRFTISPRPSFPNPERLSVSAITSAQNPSACSLVTVRQTPFTAMLSPIFVFSNTFFAFIEIEPELP